MKGSVSFALNERMKQQQSERDAHVMPYVVKCLMKENTTLLFGPFPVSDKDVFDLCVKQKVGCMINLLPETEEVTAKGKYNKASWYTCYFGKDGETEDKMKRAPYMYREAAFPQESLDQINETRRLQFFAVKARRIANFMRSRAHAAGTVYYMHYKTGFREEAIMAMVVWSLFAPDTCPYTTFEDWIQKQDHPGVLVDDEDVAFMKLACKEAKNVNQVTTLTKWLAPPAGAKNTQQRKRKESETHGK